MRPIEFRLIQDDKVVGYEKHALCCGTVSIMHRKDNESVWDFIYPDYKHWIPHNSKEQLIGRKDKNDKEIYAGDKLKHSQGIDTVIWSTDRWVIGNWIPGEIDNTMEVVGNIHDKNN